MSGANVGAGETTKRAPRFCPRCRAEREANDDLCPACGDSLQAQGYCPICETYLPQPAGTECPKHDVKLEHEEPAREAPVAGPLVTLATFPRPGEAEALRIRLEAEGIPAFLQGTRMGTLEVFQVATGGVRLQVPEALLSEARVLLNQTWALPAHDEEDLDDAWEELAPEPGHKRRTAMKVFIVVMLLGPAVLAVLRVISPW